MRLTRNHAVERKWLRRAFLGGAMSEASSLSFMDQAAPRDDVLTKKSKQTLPFVLHGYGDCGNRAHSHGYCPKGYWQRGRNAGIFLYVWSLNPKSLSASKSMIDSERENWRRIRARGQTVFVCAMVMRRCLWLAVPVVIAVALSGFLSGQAAGFWTDLPVLIGMFAGVTLLIGIGDGIFLWRLREREYERNLCAWEPSAPAPPARPAGNREISATASRQPVR